MSLSKKVTTPHQVKSNPVRAGSSIRPLCDGKLVQMWLLFCQSPQPAFFCVRHCVEWPQVLWTILHLDPAVLPFALSLLFPPLASAHFSLLVAWMSKQFLPFKLGKDLVDHQSQHGTPKIPPKAPSFYSTEWTADFYCMSILLLLHFITACCAPEKCSLWELKFSISGYTMLAANSCWGSSQTIVI